MPNLDNFKLDLMVAELEEMVLAYPKDTAQSKYIERAIFHLDGAKVAIEKQKKENHES